MALYPYKPQKADELELYKGGIYMVTERCQDGWFKGTSNRTQKCGVFPGNYVALYRSIGRSPHNPEPKLATVSYTRSSSKASKSPAVSPRQGHNNIQPPELPPRSVSPSVGTATISSSWHGQPDGANAGITPLGRSQSAVMGTASSNLANATVTAQGKSNDKV